MEVSEPKYKTSHILGLNGQIEQPAPARRVQNRTRFAELECV
jgi:hypothetical protein